MVNYPVVIPGASSGPRTSATRYRKKKKSRFSSVRRNKAPLLVTSNLAGIIPRLRTKLMWYNEPTRITFDNTNNLTAWSFDLNNIYDPDKGAVAVQPVGRDRLAALYSLYLVRSVKIMFDVSVDKVTFDTSGTTSVIPPARVDLSWIAWPLEDITTTGPTPSHIEGLPNSKVMSISPGTTRRFSKTINIGRLTGCYGNPFNNGYGGNTGSAPGRRCAGYFEVKCAESSASVQCAVNVRQRILFDVEYAQPKIAAYDTN